MFCYACRQPENNEIYTAKNERMKLCSTKHRSLQSNAYHVHHNAYGNRADWTYLACLEIK